jgi:DNA repair exonuclease SbcCD nuclease subunit
MQGEDNDIAAALTQVFMGFAAQAADAVGRGDKPHILLGHWKAEGATVHGQDYVGQEICIGYDAMMLADPDCVCLGHIHDKQQIRDRVFYPGGIYQKNYGEMGDKGAWLHVFEGRKLVESRYIQTPSRKLFVDRNDLCNFPIAPPNTAGCAGAEVRCEITCWQDEAGAVSRDLYQKAYMDAGAKSVEIVLIRVPRQTVRNDLVLKASTLRDKLVAMAALRGETVPESVLLKADALEARTAEQIVESISKGENGYENQAA